MLPAQLRLSRSGRNHVGVFHIMGRTQRGGAFPGGLFEATAGVIDCELLQNGAAGDLVAHAPNMRFIPAFVSDVDALLARKAWRFETLSPALQGSVFPSLVLHAMWQGVLPSWTALASAALASNAGARAVHHPTPVIFLHSSPVFVAWRHNLRFACSGRWLC